MGDGKDTTTRVLSSGTDSLFEGMRCVFLFLASPKDRMLWALSQGAGWASQAGSSVELGERSPEIKWSGLQRWLYSP